MLITSARARALRDVRVAIQHCHPSINGFVACKARELPHAHARRASRVAKESERGQRDPSAWRDSKRATDFTGAHARARALCMRAAIRAASGSDDDDGGGGGCGASATQPHARRAQTACAAAAAAAAAAMMRLGAARRDATGGGAPSPSSFFGRLFSLPLGASRHVVARVRRLPAPQTRGAAAVAGVVACWSPVSPSPPPLRVARCNNPHSATRTPSSAARRPPLAARQTSAWRAFCVPRVRN